MEERIMKRFRLDTGSFIDMQENKVLSDRQATNLLNKLADENEQLKQRNNRQYKQLNHLWTLMEKQDWETLTDMVEQMKKDEEQLQSEWGTYGDVE